MTWTYRFSAFLLFCVLILLLAGGLVTSHEAGLAVPDWPLSYGQLFPPMVGNIFWEHGHRMIAGTVGILTLILAAVIQKTDPRPWMRRLGWTALLVVVLQALLGGLTVLMMLPPAVSIFHACLAQTFFCLVVAITYFLSPTFEAAQKKQNMPAELKSLRKFMTVTVGMIFIQLILGAVLRHTGHAIAFHIVMAFIVFLHIVVAGVRFLNLPDDPEMLPQIKPMRIASVMIGLAVIMQVFLGFGALIYTRMLERGYAPSTGEVLFTAAHQTAGAVILALAVFMTLLVWRKA